MEKKKEIKKFILTEDELKEKGCELCGYQAEYEFDSSDGRVWLCKSCNCGRKHTFGKDGKRVRRPEIDMYK